VAAGLERLGVVIRTGAAVDDIRRTADERFLLRTSGEERAYDAVVNCTYANVSRVSRYLGHQTPRRQYEYTVSPVIELPDRSIPSITILDGPFFGLLPLNASGDILLFHVFHSVVAREDRDYVDPTWLDPATAPFAAIDKARWLRTIMDEATRFIPELRNARVKGVREGARMVLANVDDTDTRPSMVRLLEPGYVEVFSGKIVHSAWVGGEVERLLDGGAGSLT
jgi:glycine/D-amino acid oxidase-like deaminating enzyme